MWYLEAVNDVVVFVHANPKISDDLPQERSNDHLTSMVGDNYDLPAHVAKRIVATYTAHPRKSGCFGNLAEVTVREEPKPTQAATSMRQVPTNAGAGASSSLLVVSR